MLSLWCCAGQPPIVQDQGVAGLETLASAMSGRSSLQDAEELGLAALRKNEAIILSNEAEHQDVCEDVFSLSVDVFDSSEAAQLFDSCSSTAVHVPRRPPPGSAFARAGAESSSGRRLEEGDYVVSVNGVVGDVSEMLREAECSRRLDVRACRPVLFDIRIELRGRTLGCVINFDIEAGRSLLIELIRPGALQTWNVTHPEKLVRANDRIVAVDSQKGSGVELHDMIKAGKGPLELTISRPKWLPPALR